MWNEYDLVKNWMEKNLFQIWNAWSHGDDMSAIEHILLVVANDLFYLFLLVFLPFSIFSLDIGGRNRPSQLLLTKSTSTCQLTCYVHFSSQDARNIITFRIEIPCNTFFIIRPCNSLCIVKIESYFYNFQPQSLNLKI